MSEIKIQKTALVTGSAGFIGFHVARCLIKEGWQVIGLDCLSDYYDVTLKRRREEILLRSKNFKSIFGRLEDPKLLERIFEKRETKYCCSFGSPSWCTAFHRQSRIVSSE